MARQSKEHKVRDSILSLLSKHYPDAVSTPENIGINVAYDGHYVELQWEPGNSTRYNLTFIHIPGTNSANVIWRYGNPHRIGTFTITGSEKIGFIPGISDIFMVRAKLSITKESTPDAIGIAKACALVFAAWEENN